ncbi:CHAT domain-containing protein [Pilimelia terevasa]|uniref:CHAT domain-containing protein n=1 Tax=Pilimelia terevasa TaxID=53372 RepID=A0A8J3FI82_9ACTN|nr:CHAT domain-containing protein [Pilimelia terevasa]GGK28713.1 CHAT domain-containing protein [Pilimelia terevasa]
MSARAAQLHAEAVRATERGQHDEAWSLLRAALGAQPPPACRARILVSLAFHEAERRSLAAGLALLDEADTGGLPDQVRGIVAMQRGLLHLRAGAPGPALAGFDAAIALLDESEPQDICRTLLNRGMLRLAPGSLVQAEADFARCVRIADSHDLTLLAAKARHNLGYLALLAGDLPRAIREMDAVAPVLADHSPTVSAVYHVDRASVLLTAGLFHEADEDLRQAAALFAVTESPQDQAETALARAQLAQRQERWGDARAHATTARRLFGERGAAPWALVADAVLLATDLGAGRGLAAVQVAGAALAARLRQHGLADEGRRTALTAAAAALRRRDGRAGPAGQRALMARHLAGDALRLRRDDPIGTRMQARALRADLADAEQEPKQALVELRAAVSDLQQHQASFGSLDLQTAAAAHVERLAAQGLRRALEQGVPAAVLAWTERARALSARLAPVSAPADAAAAEMLAELRHAQAALRTGALAGHPDPVLRTRCLALQRQIRQRAWYRPGPRQVTAPAALRDIVGGLGTGTLVTYLVVDEALHALVVSGRRRELVALGAAAPLYELQRRWRADLDALAAETLPPALRASVRTACARAAAGVDDLLARPLAGRLGDGPLLVAPPARLATLPWTLLPTLRGRPLSVVRSPTAWLAARPGAALPPRPVVTVAAGPLVARADAEVKLVADTWPDAVTLGGPAATAAAVRAAAGSTDVLHVAAHGVHEPDNPLFSYLQLADGPLYGHECDSWERPPRHVVLSACELGLSHRRPGDETLGMTAALLHGGAGSVVAGLARIGDEVAYAVGPVHHGALRRGLPPAAALAEALESVDTPTPLVCFGAGW